MIVIRTISWVFKLVSLILIVTILGSLLWVAQRGGQPMDLPQIPAGITYWQFMADRVDAASEIQPARCGYGMFAFLLAAGPFYSVLYTYIGLYPDSFLAHVSQKDPNIPMGVAGAPWYQVPEIWWKIVEKLSWIALAKQGPGCNFRPVQILNN